MSPLKTKGRVMPQQLLFPYFMRMGSWDDGSAAGV